MILSYMAGAAAESPVSNAAGSELRTLLKPSPLHPPDAGHGVKGTRPVSVLVSFTKFDDVRRLPLEGEDPRSQALLTLRERSSTDLESVLGVSPRESELASPAMLSRDDRAGLRQHSGLAPT
jgi:hypothetical protein